MLPKKTDQIEPARNVSADVTAGCSEIESRIFAQRLAHRGG